MIDVLLGWGWLGLKTCLAASLFYVLLAVGHWWLRGCPDPPDEFD